MDQFVACFKGLKDPRSGNAGLHDLHELLVIALCAVLSGGQGATQMAAFAVAKEPFLCDFLKLESGLPSHYTFSRLFRLLDPEQFRSVLQRFMTRFADTVQGVVAIDGKVLRRSFDRASSKSALHMVSAWGEQHMVPAQIATDAKSNEITAVPKLLEMLSLKGNQGTLYDDVVHFFDDAATTTFTAKRGVAGDHGRIETRTATVGTDIEWLQDDHQWSGLTAIAKVDRMRETPTKTASETADYLLSSALSPERCNEVVRSRWGIENRLHWRLVVTMNEEQDRTRLDNAPHNLAVPRHMALNVMQKDNSKESLRGKFMRAGWDDRYLARLLALF